MFNISVLFIDATIQPTILNMNFSYTMKKPAVTPLDHTDPALFQHGFKTQGLKNPYVGG